MYKNCIDCFAPIFVRIVNYSLVSGQFPTLLKIAKVEPVFKNNGSNQIISNYRPISVLKSLSKILETVVKVRLLKYLNTIEFFNSSQYGFIKNSNTEIAITD